MKYHIPCSTQLLQAYERVSDSSCSDADYEKLRWLLQCHLDEALRVLSFSELHNSPTMWTHYADRHRGICLEYKTSYIIPCRDGILSQVEYTCDRPRVHLTEEAFRETDLFKALACSKYHGWSYEKEWRIIIHSNDSYYQLQDKSLTRIIMGYQINKRHKDYLRRLISCCGSIQKPVLAQASLDKTSFEIRITNLSS